MALTCQLVWFKRAKRLPVREVRNPGAVIDTIHPLGRLYIFSVSLSPQLSGRRLRLIAVPGQARCFEPQAEP